MQEQKTGDHWERFAVRTPVRISFAGGGTDLPAYFERYGGAVLSGSINKYTYTSIRRRADSLVQVTSCGQSFLDHWRVLSKLRVSERQGALTIPISVLRELGLAQGLDLVLQTEVPPGSGLGCSASACVGTIHAMARYLQMELTKQEMAEKAFSVVSGLLRKPVGKQDEFAAAFGGLNFLIFEPSGSTRVTPLALRADTIRALERKLMLFFTGIVHNSWVILREEQKSIRQCMPETLGALHRLRELAVEMRDALLDENLRQFGFLLHQAWKEKKTISAQISNTVIDGMYCSARRKGALGGKITGAGGGGFLLLYCDEEHQAAVREVLSVHGAEEMRFEFDFEGSKVLEEDSARTKPRWSAMV